MWLQLPYQILRYTYIDEPSGFFSTHTLLRGRSHSVLNVLGDLRYLDK